MGSRGFGPMFAPVILGHSSESAYAEAANEQLMVIVQMESKGGVAECERIAEVDGVDCLFIGAYSERSGGLCVDSHIGPFDLAKQLGVERKGPEHEAAIQRILKAAHSAGKTAAIFCELFIFSILHAADSVRHRGCRCEKTSRARIRHGVDYHGHWYYIQGDNAGGCRCRGWDGW